MSNYSIGIDYGTLSGRAVLLDLNTGKIVATAVKDYPHAIISDNFINGEKLPVDFKLQHPQDYLDVLYSVVPQVLKDANVSPDDVSGVCVDFTACTMLPVDKNGVPLCFFEEFKNNPHAYVKLWQHHSAQKYADKLNALAKEHKQEWLHRYGGTISSEWLFPKLMETLEEAPEVYDSAYAFVDASDWIVWQLTGKQSLSACIAGFKWTWSEKSGFPDKNFLKLLNPKLENVVGDKLYDKVSKLSQTVGNITDEASKKTGLSVGTEVKAGLIDAHAALPAVGATSAGTLVMIIGTSTCHFILGDKEKAVKGIAGCVKDGVVDGLYAYEAGQACVGDSFNWFVKNCLPESYMIQAKAEGLNPHQLLRKKAENLAPSAGGLMAIDWFNGNRSPYVNGNLTGLILGLTTTTRPEQIYKALIESTAYGTRRIVELFEQSDLPINKIIAVGGIAEKDPLLMQIYADVLGKEISVPNTSQACALGSAIFASVNERGFSDLNQAVSALSKAEERIYSPNSNNTAQYDLLYNEYKRLSEYFAGGENKVMEKLKSFNN